MDEKHKTRIGHYKFDIILLSLVITVVLVYELYISRIPYIAGLKGNPFYFLLSSTLIFLLLLGLFIVLLIIAFINLIRLTIKACKAKKMEWLKILLSLVPFFSCIFLFFDAKPGAIYFLQGYEKWVQKEVDVASIQKWLISLDTAYSGKEYFEAKDFPEELPIAITKLNPYHIYFSEFDVKNRSVEFEWGCALGHFGIRIGLPGMETPKEGCIKISESTVEYRRPIQPGVYIFYRD